MPRQDFAPPWNKLGATKWQREGKGAIVYTGISILRFNRELFRLDIHQGNPAKISEIMNESRRSNIRY
jgi:hypothetical protein